MQDIQSLVSTYLPDAEIMQLATVKDCKPWLCTVHYAHDPETLEMYWMSLQSRRHSIELEENPAAAVAIVISAENRQALQMQGTAHKVSGEQIKKANTIYAAKFGEDPDRLQAALSAKPEDHVYYAFRPSTIVLFDKVTFPNNPRQEILL
jgi:uncharacterized protein YhbP (UPF0306 family)